MTGLLLWACATRAPAWDPAPHLPSPELGAVFASADTEEIFLQAIDRREAGDLEGAMARLAWMRDRGDDSAEVLYQIGVTWEVAEDFEQALLVYDDLLARHRAEDVRRDAGFRRAVVLDQLGEGKAALKQLKKVRPPSEGFDTHDRATYDLQLGVALADQGRDKRAREVLAPALAITEGREDLTWMAGRGWAALLDMELAAAAELELVGSEKKVTDRFVTRREHLAAATDILVDHLVPLQEPTWLLHALLALGDASVALHRDLVASTVPRRLSDEQAAIYQQLLHQQAASFLADGWRCYDEGASLAGRLHIDNRYARLLRERRDALDLTAATSP